MGSLRRFLLVTAAGCALFTAGTAAWADDPPAKPAQSAAKPSPAPLDLTPPNIRRVLPAQELEGPLADLDEPEEAPPTVEVKGEQEAPYVPGGIAALWWGFTHPSQSWRIFTPVQ